jgi:hypothetical protein
MDGLERKPRSCMQREEESDKGGTSQTGRKVRHCFWAEKASF